jgi:hypothetical protein
LALLLKDVRICPAELLDGSSITRSGTGRWLHLQGLLRHATVAGTLTLVVSDGQWPSDAQLDAVVAAIAQQRCAWRLRLQVVERVTATISRAKWSALISRLGRFFSRLAAEAPQVTSLEVSCEAAAIEADPSPLLQALAQLSSIQHLACSIGPHHWKSRVHVMHLSPLTALTALTSLEVGTIRDSPHQAAAASMQQLMQLLSQLTRLQRLKLGVYLDAINSVRAQLPDLPSLRHLHLDTCHSGLVLLLLSEEHCAQLESLSCPQFQPAAGVNSMEQLTQLEVMRMPRQEQQQGQEQQQQQEQQELQQQLLLLLLLQHEDQDEQGHSGPLLPLRFPRLQRAKLQSEYDLPFLEDLASKAPAIEELDLGEVYIWGEVATQRMAQLLAQLPPLTSFAAAHSCYDLAIQPCGALSAWLTRQTRIQSLTVADTIPQGQLPVLRACASLRELGLLHQDSTAALHALPPQLTALTYLHNTAAEPTKVPRALVPPLKRLELRVGCAAALQALPLAELTPLTSLRTSASNMSIPADISRLSQLVELQGPGGPGLGQQLAGLKELRKLELSCARSSDLQACELDLLTQLRELRVMGWRDAGQRQLGRRLAQQLGKALPHCIMQFD